LASLIFEIVSNFAIRISRFVDRICLNHALWAEVTAGPSGPESLLFWIAQLQYPVNEIQCLKGLPLISKMLCWQRVEIEIQETFKNTFCDKSLRAKQLVKQRSENSFQIIYIFLDKYIHLL
jgi:hypothetical protein